MMENQKLVVVKQLPVIEERLKLLKESVESQVSEALSLACTADTVQAVKQKRAELSASFREMEDLRKTIKKEVLAPYEAFEAVYKECVSDAYSRADLVLKERISDVETAIKDECEAKLRVYFLELCEAADIDWLSWERMCVKVDMASAKQKIPRKLMQQIKERVDCIANDLSMISSMPDAAEITVEYRKTLNATAAISSVQERKRLVEVAKASAEAIKPAAPTREEQEFFQMPKRVEKAAVKKYTAHFAVTATLEQLKLLKKWMADNGYEVKGE